MAGIGRLSVTAVDCPDPHSLARFYAALAGWPVAAVDDEDDWVELSNPGGPTIAFQQVADYRPPTWPDGERPQQMHLDIEVPDLDAGEAQVIALGATKADYQPGTTFRVYLDPAGHPFCLVLRS